MDFELTDRQEDVQKKARDFASREFSKEEALELDESYTFPREIWKKACQSGLVGVHFARSTAARGYGVTENILIVEELCRGDSGIGIALSLADFSSEVVLRFGTPEQKQKYLIPVVRGEFISAGAYTEPDHGSDITLSVYDRNQTGRLLCDQRDKNVHHQRYPCRLSSSSSARPIPMPHLPTVDNVPCSLTKEPRASAATEIKPKMGIRMTSTAQLSFSDVKVPLSNLIGDENKGFYQVLEFFDESRIEIAAQALGISQGAFDRALDYVKNRKTVRKAAHRFSGDSAQVGRDGNSN